MKILKVIGMVILILIAIFIILGLIAPARYAVTRSIEIKAPRELVFGHVQFWRHWQAWSPWAERDTSMIVTISGIDGAEGALYLWEGDPKITGKGEMTNTGVIPLEEVAFQTHFIEPWESMSDGYFRFSAQNDTTMVSWEFNGDNPFPWNVFALFMSMDRMIGKDMERGLNLLQQLCEKEAEIILSYQIKEITLPAINYAVIRKNIGFPEMEQFFSESYTDLMTNLGKNMIRMTGPPSALYFSWDEQNMQTELAAAIPIRGTFNKGNVSTISIPQTKAYQLDYYGPYDGLALAHQALDMYLMKQEAKFVGPAIEEYVSDPMTETDPAKWLTRIYYPVEK
ncbi:MAG: GyrI-like domain-containing protein [Candidatus Cloacimonetes bacterium]|nr:GyrI-like domain-containing protein [Candidatus Cloacimonadota bacterium]